MGRVIEHYRKVGRTSRNGVRDKAISCNKADSLIFFSSFTDLVAYFV